MWNIAAFILFSIILGYISRTSLTSRHSHGFYRFFAWEAILSLILLNLPDWFRDWFAWYQIISWFLLIICILPLAFGIYDLRSRGLPDKDKRPEPRLLGFERTTILVTSGIYRFIRHPMYSSLFLLDWGIFFKKPSPLGALLAISATFFLILTAKADEAECLITFGSQYRDYMKTTKKFIPLIY